MELQKDKLPVEIIKVVIGDSDNELIERLKELISTK